MEFCNGVRCVASGRISQNNYIFGNNANKQCLCISVCACAFVAGNDFVQLNSSVIDELIIAGNSYYTQSKELLGPDHRECYLNTGEVSASLEFRGNTYNIEVNWLLSGLFPSTLNVYDTCLAQLETNLRHCFQEHHDCGHIFIGLLSAVSFWKRGGKFFLFNSHSTDINGRTAENGVGRVFQFDNLKELAQFLFKNAPLGGNDQQYEISWVTATQNENARLLSLVTVTDTKFSDPKLQVNPYVVLNRVDASTCVADSGINIREKRKPGRPTKNKRGRPKTSTLDRVDTSTCVPDLGFDMCKKRKTGRPTEKKRGRPNASTLDRLDASTCVPESGIDICKKKYPGRPTENKQRRPKTSTLSTDEQHLEAVKRYTVKNPEVNRKAVKQYSDNNPDIHLNSVERYSVKHPEVNREAVRIYADKNPGRHLPTALRKDKLISQYSGESLNSIKPYKLKNISLQAENTKKCCHCGARLFKEEEGRAQWCCGQGKYNVQELPPLCNAIYKNKDFLQHPRLYNDLFAFSALSVPHGYKHPRGLSFMKIQGRTYHKVYDLSCEGPNSSFYYIDDGKARLMEGEKQKLKPALIKEIAKYIESCNPYASLYKRLNDEPSDNAHLVFEATTRRKHGPVLGDRPQTTEVLALLSLDADAEPNKFCIWKRGAKEPRLIDGFHFLVEPFQYPLLYPEGTAGWHIGRTENRTNKKLTQLKYIRCLLLSEDRFSRFGALSETWIIDMYARIEWERLRYIQYMQKTKQRLRTAPLDEVLTAVGNDETIQGEGSVVAGRVYLPRTHTGGPRYMKVCYMDAMAIVNRLGGPTYFLTFTAYGGWEEIAKSKYENSKQEAHLCNRVFQLKLLELLRDIRCGKFFGANSYIIWVIEFQMRGLPHAHICFRVTNGGPTQNYEIDRVVRADIPKEEEANGRLREIVLRHHRHGPCGEGYRTDLPCWDTELHRCTKYYPKPHTETTFTDERGFVQYKRNENNKATVTFRGRPFEVDDRWIVPYNPALLLKYECHANLEIASTRRIVKYLFKYISKGTPIRRMTVVEERDADEVEEYVSKRCIGTTDAVWRILEFDLTGREPTVINLPVHLEGKQNVIFIAGEEQEACAKSSSLLLLYFGRPDSMEMDALTYLDFYENYIIHSHKPRTSVEVITHSDGIHFITKRQRGSCVARLFWVAPTRGEQYYLRMLIAKFPCHSYNDLYKLGGPSCTTFQQAARELGLADDKNEYFEAIEEASKFMTANKLRRFFVMLFSIGGPAPEMWSSFKELLCEDFLEQLPGDEEKAHKLGLIQIDRCLRRQGSSLLEAGLPLVEDDSTELGRERLMYSRTIQEKFVQEWEPRLSPDQRSAFQSVKLLLQQSRKSNVIFLDGPGGSGKTLLLRVMSAYVRSLDRIALCVASSGIASQNLAGGTTAHSMFRLPLDIYKDGYWSVTNRTQRADLIRESSLIIFDEAPMAHKQLFELLDRSLRDLMGNDELFGGKIFVLAGDFRQIPPVVEKAKSPSDVVQASIRTSYIWKFVNNMSLKTSHRLTGEEEYSRFLLQLGSNQVSQCVIGENDNKEVVIALHLLKHVATVEELISFVFPADILRDPEETCKRVIISTHNSNVKQINQVVMRLLDGEVEKLFSVDSVADMDDGVGIDIDQTLLNYAQGKGVPDHILQLKIGSICILMRNLNFDLGLVNGTKVIIVGISRRLITCRKPGENELHGIPRITFKFPIFANSPVEMYRRQYPLQVCYAITVHKSQGQTIDIVGVDLRSDCFTHGQLYVALSRVRSPEHIRVLVPDHRIVDGVAHTKNVVYDALLN